MEGGGERREVAAAGRRGAVPQRHGRGIRQRPCGTPPPAAGEVPNTGPCGRPGKPLCIVHTSTNDDPPQDCADRQRFFLKDRTDWVCDF